QRRARRPAAPAGERAERSRDAAGAAGFGAAVRRPRLRRRRAPRAPARPARPRAGGLTVGRGEGATVVDAWRALQALRAAGLAERPDDEQAPGAAGTARGITLQHLLFGASVGSRVVLGAPGATEGSGFEDDATAAYSRPGAGG